MATIIRFEDLEIWQLARSLNREIWQLTAREEFRRMFFLNDQLRRASLSVMNNISEGFDRDGNREFKQFLSIAKASAGEVKNMLYALSDVGLINQTEFNKLSAHVELTRNKITKLMVYLKNTEYKGKKYKPDNPTDNRTNHK